MRFLLTLGLVQASVPLNRDSCSDSQEHDLCRWNARLSIVETLIQPRSAAVGLPFIDNVTFFTNGVFGKPSLKATIRAQLIKIGWGKNISTGCSEEDYPIVFPPQAIVLVSRGNCKFVQKANVARAYHAMGIIIMNNNTDSQVVTPVINGMFNFTVNSNRYQLCIIRGHEHEHNNDTKRQGHGFS